MINRVGNSASVRTAFKGKYGNTPLFAPETIDRFRSRWGASVPRQLTPKEIQESQTANAETLAKVPDLMAAKINRLKKAIREELKKPSMKTLNNESKHRVERVARYFETIGKLQEEIVKLRSRG